MFSAEPGGAVEITTLSLDRGTLSPNGDGRFDSDTLRVAFTSVTGTLARRGTLNQNGVPLHVVIPIATIDAGSGSETLGWAGLDSTAASVPEGTYDLVIHLADAAGADRDSVPITIDVTAPAFTSATLSGPEGPYGDGDYITIAAVFAEDPDSIWIDPSHVDGDTLNWTSLIVQPHGGGEFGLLYRISPANPLPDGTSLIIPVFAADAVANVAENSDITVCLSNIPPLAESAALLRSGVEVADNQAYTSGDTVRVRGRFQSATDTLVVSADFSEVDSEYHILFNPAILDTSYAVPIVGAARLAPEYAFQITAELHYVLSAENRRTDGRYGVHLTARDLGCGAVDSRRITLDLTDLGPDRPRFDPVGEIWRSATIVLTGDAPGAGRIEILRGNETEAEGDVESGGEFAIEVALAPGSNTFTAVAYDSLGHSSPLSNQIDVFRAGETRVEIPQRLRPGDPIEIILFDAPVALEIEIFNLVGDRIWTQTALDPGERHEFRWDGRNRSGHRVLSGPYVAVVTAKTSRGAERTERAFVFTRE